MPEPRQASPSRHDEWRPSPDPTLLTTAALMREVAALRELIEAKSAGQYGIFEARFEGMDRAVRLLQTIFDRIPAEIEARVSGLKTLHEEKFSSIQIQFTERDTRAEQTSRDSKTAVDAALQAAKEAVGKQNEASDRAILKSEGSTSKEIDGLKTLINDVKDRLNRIEGEGRGQQAAKTTQETSNTSQLGWIGLVFGTLIGLGGLLAAFLRG